MNLDIQELEQQLAVESRESRKKKDIREIVGFAMVEAMERAYEKWQEKKTPASRKRVLTWRLRVRLRFNHMPDVIEKLNKVANVGLLDEEVGPLYDDMWHEDTWTGMG